MDTECQWEERRWSEGDGGWLVCGDGDGCHVRIPRVGCVRTMTVTVSVTAFRRRKASTIIWQAAGSGTVNGSSLVRHAASLASSGLYSQCRNPRLTSKIRVRPLGSKFPSLVEFLHLVSNLTALSHFHLGQLRLSTKRTSKGSVLQQQPSLFLLHH